MSAIILSTSKSSDLRLLTDLAQRLGISFFTIPKLDDRTATRNQLLEWAVQTASPDAGNAVKLAYEAFLDSPEFEKFLQQELANLNVNESAHLEAEFAGYESQYPVL